MSSLRKAGPFLLLPLLFTAAAFLFSRAAGPFYLAYRYDPEYAYLLNGLNLVLGWVPEHIDHPGTPLQLLWAVVLRLSQPTASEPDLAMRVLTGAEGCLQTANTLFIPAYALALAWLGLSVARLTHSRTAGWLAQGAPFLLEDNFLLFTRVNPEPFLLLVGVAVIPVFLRLALSETPPGWGRLSGLSALAATGLCLKITFAPVALAALILLPDTRGRLRFVALTLLGCLLWTLPIMTEYPRLLRWIWGLAAHQGQYGLGPTGLVRPTTYLAGLGTLLGHNPLFAVTLLAGAGTWWASRSAATGEDSIQPWRRLLLALVLAQVAQLVISAKNPQSRYLAPAGALLALSWLAIARGIRATWPAAIGRYPRLAPAAAIALALALLADLGTRYVEVRTQAIRHRALSALTARPGDGVRVFYYGASSPVYALVFGSAFAGLHYSRSIEATLGADADRTWFLDNWRGLVYSLRGRIDPRELERLPGSILLHGDYLSEPERQRLPVTGTLTVLGRFEDETVYELRPEPGN